MTLKKELLCLLGICLFIFSCAEKPEKPEMTVLIRMMDIQDLWFREKMKQFENENQVKINVVTFDQVEDVREMIDLERKSGKKTIGLVKTAMEMIYPLAEQDYLIPLEDITGFSQLQQDLNEYLPEALAVGTVDDKVYYIPRKLETYLLFFLKSKVQDALDDWHKDREEINLLLKDVNGYGLPKEYRLESDPQDWDYYDLAVLAYFWANHPYQGLTLPRVAHRGKRYAGTVNELITRIYQLGGNEEDVLSMITDPVIDCLQWESFFIRNDLYHPGMWEQAFSGGDIWKAISQGEVFLCFLHQIDLFFVHGGSDPTMTGYLLDPEDMGLSIMPEGGSLDLSGEGRPQREGSHFSNLYGWWWGIPVTSPDPKLSYRLARFITSKENQIEECSRFGMYPVRNDVIDNLEQVFDAAWKQKIFRVSRLQFESGTRATPQLTEWPQIGKNYLDAWYEIAVEKQLLDRKAISKAIDKYAQLNQTILSTAQAEE